MSSEKDRSVKGHHAPGIRLGAAQGWHVFLATALLGVLTHGFRLTNKFYTGDSYNYLESIARTWTTSLGRYLLYLVEVVRGPGEVTWLIGCMSIVFIALAAVLVAQLFSVKNAAGWLLLGLALVANPAVTATFAHMYTADGYFFGMLLSVLAVWLCARYGGWRGVAGGALALGISMALYQAYVSMAAMLVLVLLLRELMTPSRRLKDVLCSAGRYLLMGVMALIPYLIGLWASFRYLGVTMASYQGVGEQAAHDLAWLVDAVRGCYVEYARFLLVRWKWSFYSVTNVLWMALIVATICRLVVKRRLYLAPWRILMAALIGLLIPIATHLFCFVASPTAYVSVSLSYSMCTIYLIPMALEDGPDLRQWRRQLWQCATTLLLALICWNFIVGAGKSYESMYLANDQMENLLNRMIMRMEMQEGYEETMDVAIIGNTYQTSEYIDNMPVTVSVVSRLFMNTSNQYISAMNWYASTSYHSCSDSRKRELVETAEFQEMELWPSARSIRVIDGTMVVYLSEYGVEELK